MPTLKKGSKAAKDFMAKLRAAKGKTKPKKVALKKIGYKPDRMAIVKKATKKISSYKAKGYTRKDAIKLANKDAAFSVNGIKKMGAVTKNNMTTHKTKIYDINKQELYICKAFSPYKSKATLNGKVITIKQAYKLLDNDNKWVTISSWSSRVGISNTYTK